jgi:hypothetical protein
MRAYPYRTPIAVAFLLLFQGCIHTSRDWFVRQNVASVRRATRVLAVYEPWFGHPNHISVGYSSSDPGVVERQIDHAKTLGISGFVVDWYGNREPLLDRNYALLQKTAAEKNFQVAMMYDESSGENGEPATEQTLSEFEEFRRTYLAADSPGRTAYLTYNNHPVIFIFPKGGHTDWNRVHQYVQTWNPTPVLIYEYPGSEFVNAFDGLYAWINPGNKGWAADGSHWGEDYLRDFYHKMETDYSGKITVGTAWAGFDDSKASWGTNRHIAQRCGETLNQTLQLAREYDTADHPIPFLLIATWNDYEEGSAIERGLSKCGASRQS